MTTAQTSMLMIDIALAVIFALLGNEIRIIIDEQHEKQAATAGQHDAATVPNLIPVERIVIRHQRVADDRKLFERIAYDFEITEMAHPTVPSMRPVAPEANTLGWSDAG